MLGMTNVNNRSRVQAGIKTGGQFAAEAHQEPEGILLTQAPSPLDQAAVAAVGDLVRTNAAAETGRWQRRIDMARRGYEHEPPEPMPPALVEVNRQAEEFESLPRQEQDELLDKLKLTNTKHLLEPGQKLGTDKVQLADDLGTEHRQIGLALVAQRHMTEAGLPGTITMTDIGNATDFSVHDGGITHNISVGSGYLSFSAGCDDEEDYTRRSWLHRADAGVYGGSVFEENRVQALRTHFDSHREYATMMDVVACSSFREHEEFFGELDRSGRTAEIKVDDTEITLDLSGTDPILKTEDGKALHPSMASGFLDHMATRTGHADGTTFASDLREVFRETDRRLIP